jgi:exosortase E/protease (VPEID-CTERM system)
VPTTGPFCADLNQSQPDAHRFPVWWWVALASLLFGEIVFFSIQLDTGVFFAVDQAWARLMGETSLLIQLGISAIVAWFVFGGNQFAELVQRAKLQSRVEHVQWYALVGHLMAMAGLYFVSTVLFSGTLESRLQPLLWTIGWFGLLALSIALWIGAVLPVGMGKPVLSIVGKPLVFCGVLAVAGLVAGKLADRLWQPLAHWNFEVAGWLLSRVYSDVVIDPAQYIIGTSTYSVKITAACSGYEGIGMVILFLAAFIVWFRHELRFPQCLFLIPVGIFAIWLANNLRIAALVTVGSSLSPEIAGGGFHSQAGWLAFNAVTLGLVYIAWNSSTFSKLAADRATTERVEYPAAPYLVPFLVFVATVMLVGAFSTGEFDYLYGVRVFTTGAALAWFWNRYRAVGLVEWSWSWPAVGLGAVVFVLWMLLEPWSGVSSADQQAQASVLSAMPPFAAAVWIGLRILGSIAVVPVVEELAFRGYLTRRLIDKDFQRVELGRFSWFSWLGSSLVFGLMHGRWLAGSFAGLLFALALYRRGRLSDAVLAHATANALVTAYVLVTGNWATWS